MFPIKGSAPSPQTPWVTILLIAVNCAVFVWQMTLPTPALQEVARLWGFVPGKFWGLLSTEPSLVHLWGLPVITSMFMHGSLGHLIGNMLFLWVFGDGIENRIGSARFLAFYLLVGIAATLTHASFNPASGIPTVGASGAIAGVLGAYLMAYPRSWVVLLVPVLFYPLFFRVPALLFLGFWFLQQLMFGAATSLAEQGAQMAGVAWWAHAGGFVAGLAFVHLFKSDRNPPEPKTRQRLFPQNRRRW